MSIKMTKKKRDETLISGDIIEVKKIKIKIKQFMKVISKMRTYYIYISLMLLK